MLYIYQTNIICEQYRTFLFNTDVYLILKQKYIEFTSINHETTTNRIFRSLKLYNASVYKHIIRHNACIYISTRYIYIYENM